LADCYDFLPVFRSRARFAALCSAIALALAPSALAGGAFDGVAEIRVHAFKRLSRPGANHFVTGVNVANARAVPRAPIIPIVGHDSSPVEISARWVRD
jgi:hypothetical protein